MSTLSPRSEAHVSGTEQAREKRSDKHREGETFDVLLRAMWRPGGKQVVHPEEVFRIYVGVNKPSRWMLLPPLPLNLSQQPLILLLLYSIPSFVLATTKDSGVDASTATAEEPEQL